MNTKLYTKLLNFRSHSRSQTQIVFRDWLRGMINKMPNTHTYVDDYGNLYVTKGNTDIFNCVVAHLDINQSVQHHAKVYIADDWIIGIDMSTGQQIGVGHDDKAGVYFAIQALLKYDNLKVFFPLDEEAGLIGTSHCDVEFFTNVGFMVQLDRRGSSDISDYTNGVTVVTNDTKDLLNKTLNKYGYKFTSCMCTDVGDLVYVTDIQGVNISCGYYNEHSESEVLSISQYMNAEAFAFEVLDKMEGKKHTINASKHGKYGFGSYGGYSDYSDYGDKYGGLSGYNYADYRSKKSKTIPMSPRNFDGYDDDFYDEYYGEPIHLTSDKNQIVSNGWDYSGDPLSRDYDEQMDVFMDCYSNSDYNNVADYPDYMIIAAIDEIVSEIQELPLDKKLEEYEYLSYQLDIMIDYYYRNLEAEKEDITRRIDSILVQMEDYPSEFNF